MELYDNIIKKLQNDLHPDDFQDLMRGKFKKQIIELVIKEYTDLGITDLEFITNRVRDRFGLGFDPNSSIEDKVLRDLEYMLDYEHNLKGATPNKIFKNEYKTIERMKGEKSAAIAKQMIDQYRYKVRNNMKLIEAKQILQSNGYLLVKEIDENTEDRFMLNCDNWQPLKNVDPHGPYQDEYNVKYYIDGESYIYIIHYEDDEFSAELYRLDHDKEEFVGTIPNVENEDFKSALEGETIGIELDPYHYT